MNTVRQKCRPRHQVLILKCYPRFMKNAQEVKPNSSELSYLLYYASTRRSKLQKIGAFLEKKTASDVHKNKASDIQVTLQIVEALVEKNPRDLPLYAPYVLRLLDCILRSRDLSIIEESSSLFERFCAHHDSAAFAADQSHITQYEGIVRQYASYAALKTPFEAKGELDKPMAIRWRTAGLKALSSVCSSESIGKDGGRQLSIVMPAILQNLHFGDGSILWSMQSKTRSSGSEDHGQALRRRMSVATVRTTEESARPDLTTITENADDVDRIAEEEVGLMAFKSLKQIFSANNRVQIRLATSALLSFLCGVAADRRPGTGKTSKTSAGSWSTSIIELATKWTPVQGRFVILVTVMETLIRSPTAEGNLEQQLILISLVDHLLRSNINMIGLSVMDVLLGLINHVLLLLQLGGKGTSVLPHHQQTDAIDIFAGSQAPVVGPKSPVEKTDPEKEPTSPSSDRQELLGKLQKCIGALATHIYYSDQVGDIISAIFLRLKPSSASGIPSSSAAVENPEATAKAISISAQLQENPQSDSFFSFGTARVTALKAVKEVLIVANTKGSMIGAAAIGRNRVGVQVWEGTQWLLRDEDRRVRRAYVDSLLTWLRLEMSPKDLRVHEDKRSLIKSISKNDVGSLKDESLTKRAMSNASSKERDKLHKPPKSTFLQLLHLAIYDNAMESPESESDILLLHLLLYHLAEKLGVNAVKTGLPMMLRLQQDMLVFGLTISPKAKVQVASFIHGYLWTLEDKFGFEASTVGYVIQSEISRRKKHGQWLDTIQIPPIPLDRILPATLRLSSEKASTPDLDADPLKPFDSQSELVERIAEAYSSSAISPPTSPPHSPNRILSMPILAQPNIPLTRNNELPPVIRETMLSEWSKEICIASVEKASSKTVSLNGSRKGALSQYIAPNGDGIVHPNADQNQWRIPTIETSDVHRRSSAHSDPSTPASSNEQSSTLRVDDLKRVLAGGTVNGIRAASPLRHSTNRPASTGEKGSILSASSESEVSVDGFESASEGHPDVSRPVPPPVNTTIVPQDPPTISPKPTTAPTTPAHTMSTSHSRNASSSHARSRPHSGDTDFNKPPSTPRSFRRPSTSSSAAGEDPDLNAAALRGEMPRLSAEYAEEVPPVPPLPADISTVRRPISGGAVPGSPPPTHNKLPDSLFNFDHEKEKKALAENTAAAAKDKPEEKKRSSKRASANKRKASVDIQALLGSIDAVAGGAEGKKVGIARPPY